MGAKIDNLNASTHVTPLTVVGAALVVTVAVAAAGRIVSAETQVSQNSVSSYNDSSSDSSDSQTSQASQAADQQAASAAQSGQDTTEVHTSVVSSSEGSVQNTVTVNGTQYTAPAGGSVHHSEVSDDGQTRVDVNVSNQTSSGSSVQSSHTSVNTNSYSSSVQFHTGGQ